MSRYERFWGAVGSLATTMLVLIIASVLLTFIVVLPIYAVLTFPDRDMGGRIATLAYLLFAYISGRSAYDFLKENIFASR